MLRLVWLWSIKRFYHIASCLSFNIKYK